jgi:uncharacterized protein YndB with AHSA1/START domain
VRRITIAVIVGTVPRRRAGVMSRNRIDVSASPEAVFAVLDDAYAYPRWVVGTRRLRRLDADWPHEGSEFHHAVGVAGAELRDSTEVVERDAPRRLVLEVRFRPTGVARVEVAVEPGPAGSMVTMEETPQSGPVAWLPRFVSDPVLHARNAWSLQRLRHEVERRDRSAP